jgi:hypothetical protein
LISNICGWTVKQETNWIPMALLQNTQPKNG